MNIVRTVFALVIALSVAMLPAIGGGAFASHSQDAAMASMDDCPHHHHHHGAPAKKAMDDCCAMAVCALKCFSYCGAMVSELVYPSLTATIEPLLASKALHSQTGSPPFRPPRV
jgi:hypothetical protein